MKLAIAGTAVLMMLAHGAFAQSSALPPADALAVNPIPSDVQAAESDVIRTKIERAGYRDVSDLSRDASGVWRGRARKGDDSIDVVVDKGGRIKAARR